MRISDWSSDVCSSDLEALRDAFGQDHGVDRPLGHGGDLMPVVEGIRRIDGDCIGVGSAITAGRVLEQFTHGGRESVVEGKSVSVRVDLGGRGLIKKKNK